MKCFGNEGKEPLIKRNLSENDTLGFRLASTVGHRRGKSMVVGQPISNTGETAGEPESGYYLNVTSTGGADGIWLQGSASRLVKKP